MRLIKEHTTNSRSITGKGYKYNASNDFASIDANVMVIPTGTSGTKPTLPVNGMVRYNTTINEFEFYANNVWQVVRFKEPGLITKQLMSLGDQVQTIFGPLLSNDAAFPVPLSANNILVFVENVFQIAPTNFIMVENPFSTGTGDEVEVFYLVNGEEYVITNLGTDPAKQTDFTKVGASANSTGTIFTADIDLSVDQILTLKNPNGNAGTTFEDFFGYSVAINNNDASSLILVGAYKEDEPSYTESGKAYIFDISGTLLHQLDNPNPYGGATEDLFGFAVSISNTWAVVGAFQEDDAGTGFGNDSGKIYLYDLANINPAVPDYTITSPNTGGVDLTDYFGYSVSISDTHLIVGAPNEDNVTTGVGAAYLFDLSNLPNNTMIPNPDAGGSWFGSTVAISDNYIIVGTNPVSGANYQNKVYIYNIQGTLLYTLTNPNTATVDDGFGYSIDISNRYAIVGSYNEDATSKIDQGVVYIYELPANDPVSPTTLDPLFYNNPDWDGVTAEEEFLNDEFGGIVNPNPFGLATEDRFGFKVSISDVYAVVSSHVEDDANGTNSGVVYVYDLLTGERLGDIANPNGFGTAQDDQFGSAVSVSNTHLIVGAYQEDDSTGDTSGKAYVYTVQGKALGTGLVRPTGQYLEFTSPPDLGKPITVYHNFDK